MKKIHIFLLMFSLCLFGVGCLGKKEMNEKPEAGQASEGEVSSDKLCQYPIVWKQFEKETISNLLIENFDVAMMPEEQENGATIIDVGDCSLFFTSNGVLEFQNNQDAANMATLFFYYIFGDLTNEEIDFYEQAEQLQDTQDVKDSNDKLEVMLGNDNFLLNRACKMSGEKLKALEESLMQMNEEMDIVENWETGDYLALEYTITQDNLAILGVDEPQQSYVVDLEAAQPAYIRILYSNGKILYVSMRGMTDIAGEGEEVRLITKEEAMELAQAAQENIISGDTWENGEAVLEYIPVPDWTASLLEPEMLVPYWRIIQSNGEAESVIRINAVTGGNLAYGE